MRMLPEVFVSREDSAAMTSAVRSKMQAKEVMLKVLMLLVGKELMTKVAEKFNP